MRWRLRKRYLLLFVLMALPARGGAGSRAERRITIPDASVAERALFEDVKDDRLDRHDAVTAALAGSASSEKDRARAAARWEKVLETLAAETASLEPRARAGALLGRLHALVLTGEYDFDENDMAVTLLEGRYNCVTSALAFQAAGQKVGLDVRGVLVPTHVYVRVVIDGVAFDVETTSPHGFLLAKDDKAYRSFLRNMQLDNERRFGRRVEDSREFFRKEIDPIDLVAVLYTNLGSDAVKRGKGAEAIGYFARSSLLARDDRYARDSRDLLLAQAAEDAILANDLNEARRLFEFATSDPGGDPMITRRLRQNIGYCWELEAHQHLRREQFERALGAFEMASRYSNEPGIDQNRRATLAAWGLKELEAKRYSTALRIFQRARAAFPDDGAFTQNLKATWFEWIQDQIGAGTCEAAVENARRLKSALPGDPDPNEILVSAATSCADRHTAAGDWQGAVDLLDRAHETVASVDLRVKAAVILTNAGVALANSGEKAEAEAAWTRALELHPESKAARNNLERLRTK